MADAIESIHVWNRCHACGVEPITGLRFSCDTCPAGPDNDLCEPCYRRFASGALRHGALRLIGDGEAHKFSCVKGGCASEYLEWLRVPFPHCPAPVVPDRFVVRPEICSGMDSFIGSYAFAVWHPRRDEALIVTALHVLDEFAKAKGVDCSHRNNAYTGTELPHFFSHVNLYDVFADKWMFADLGCAHSMLLLPNARCGDAEPDSHRDIAAFGDLQARLSVGRWATRPPSVGEPVWLATRLNSPTREATLAAVVVLVSDRSLVFRYTAQEAISRVTSGAPILNSRGEIVGINVGGGVFQSQRFGHGNHVVNAQRHLEAT